MAPILQLKLLYHLITKIVCKLLDINANNFWEVSVKTVTRFNFEILYLPQTVEF